MEFDPMNGLLNMKPQRMVDPATQGLLAAAMAGLNASGPSRMPVGLGQVFGQAMGAGTGALQQANMQNDMAQKNNLAMQMQAYQLRKGMEGEQRVAQARSVLTNPNSSEEDRRAAMLTLDPQFALKQMFPEKGKPQLVTVTGTDGKPVQRWVTPGESAGVDVGPLYEPPKMQAVNGQIVDMRNVAPGTVIPPQANPFSDLLIPGPDGKPTVNQPLLNAKGQIAAKGAPRVNTPVTIKQEGEESKTVGKFFGEQYGDIQKSGFNASATINKLDRLQSLLDGVATGKLTPAMTEVAALAESLGVKIDKNLPVKQAARALASEIALEMRNPSGGAGMPGALSDKDREFLVQMTPNLANTPEGNRLLIDTRKKIAQRDKDVARLAAEYRRKNGNMDEGFYEVLARYAEANPLFTPKAPAAPRGNVGGPAKFLGFE